MHPVFSSARYLIAFGGLWLALSGLTSVLMCIQLGIEMSAIVALYLPLLFVFFFFCLSNYYVCLRFPIKHTPAMQMAAIQFIAIAITVGIWLVVGREWALLLGHLTNYDWLSVFAQSVSATAMVGALLYCFWIIAHYIYLLAEQNDEIERASLKQQLLISEIELQATKSTIHPHFLYNSLNTVANLSLSEPEKVHNICLQIADFLRYSVNYANRECVTMAEEIEHVQNYLAIERERYGKRLEIQFDIDESVRGERVIPLLLFPLVENAIKHGIETLIEGGVIAIAIDKDEGLLSIEVSNSYDPLGMKRSGTKLGLSVLKKRLMAEFGRAARVDVQRTEDRFIVKLRMPANSLHSITNCGADDLANLTSVSKQTSP